MSAAGRHPGLNLDNDDAVNSVMETGLFGFWIFLMSDAVIFALLFATYGTMLNATAGAPGPNELFELKPAFIETLVLLLSSFTWGLGAIALKYNRGRRGALLGWMALTFALGLIFLGLEARDFASMFEKNAYPSQSGFLSAFFALVPLHGLHVLAGCLWIVVMAGQILTIGIDTKVKINLLRLGLFWHFLDIVWIGIFSIVYLQGLA